MNMLGQIKQAVNAYTTDEEFAKLLPELNKQAVNVLFTEGNIAVSREQQIKNLPIFEKYLNDNNLMNTSAQSVIDKMSEYLNTPRAERAENLLTNFFADQLQQR